MHNDPGAIAHGSEPGKPLPVFTDGLNAEEKAIPFGIGIEFCSGTAGLTAQLGRLGMKNSFGVDHVVIGGSKAPIVKIDFTTAEGEALAASYIKSPMCGYVHFGIPCGTSSRAREIHIRFAQPVQQRQRVGGQSQQGL